MSDLKKAVLICAALLGGIILTLSAIAFVSAYRNAGGTPTAMMTAFNLIVPTVLIPMFTTIVTAAVAYIFGQQFLPEIASRIVRARQDDRGL